VQCPEGKKTQPNRREILTFMRKDRKPLKDSEDQQHLVSQHTRLMMLEAAFWTEGRGFLVVKEKLQH